MRHGPYNERINNITTPHTKLNRPKTHKKNSNHKAMATSRSNKGKSSGLRILWIPGRKSNPKGRFESTNKQYTYMGRQKKNEVWSLGGTKAHNDILKADPDPTLFEGPSVSGVTTAVCAIGAADAAKCAIPGESTDNKELTESTSKSPTSPSSTASTALVVSLPNSPTQDTESVTMPAKSQAAAVAITTVTTAAIIDENRFSILGKDISNEVDVYTTTLSSPPKYDLNGPSPMVENVNTPLNDSAGTTVSNATTPSPKSAHKHDTKPDKESAGTPKKTNHKLNNNNHQNDINSIESISENTKIPSDNLEWIDKLVSDRNNTEISKNKRKKTKKTKELDQLDGVASKHNASETTIDEDEKVVNCLYYTLMCCECTIS